MHATVHHKVEAKIQLNVSSSWYTHTITLPQYKQTSSKKHHSQSLKVSVQTMNTDTLINAEAQFKTIDVT